MISNCGKCQVWKHDHDFDRVINKFMEDCVCIQKGKLWTEFNRKIKKISQNINFWWWKHANVVSVSQNLVSKRSLLLILKAITLVLVFSCSLLLHKHIIITHIWYNRDREPSQFHLNSNDYSSFPLTDVHFSAPTRISQNTLIRLN